MNVAVLITCHNRREKTVTCLRSLFAQKIDDALALSVWLVDDGSTDGTGEAVAKEFPQVRQIAGSGDLFWCGGMSLAWSHAAKSDAEVFLWLNDDVVLAPDALQKLHGVALQHPDAVVVGSCSSPASSTRTYGGLYRPGLHPGKIFPVEPGDTAISCDTFEGNIVWIPISAFTRIGTLGDFQHAMGDVDYGYRVSDYGIPLLVAPGFLGTCPANSRRGTWEDPTLKRSERFRKLRSVKGLPSRDWWRFCLRNGGLCAPVYFVTPFLRILAGR